VRQERKKAEAERNMTNKKKLIEVALPLEAINIASAREKSIRHGHPSTLHIWWARRPLATARAVIFAQMVDDPSSHPDLFPTVKKQEKERQRLFKIIEDLVKWENTSNETVLQAARDEIWQSWRYTCAENADHPRVKELFDRHKLPAFHDPFAGGGTLPLEAQRLGLEAYASDLNPVAVMLNKAMIEIPPKFAKKEPVNPAWRDLPDNEKMGRNWNGVRGLANDVHYYGQWMRNEAVKRISFLYPKIEITPEMVKERKDLKQYLGEKLTVIAWLWARTVKSPNPAFADVEIPLASTFMLSTRPGNEAYVEPIIDKKEYRFTVKLGKPKDPEAAKNGTKLSRGTFRCLMSNAPFPYTYIDDEANAGRIGSRMMAIIAEGNHGQIYLPPTQEMERVAHTARPDWKPDVPSRGTWGSNAQGRIYGFRTFGDYFTPRQLVALNTFSDLVLRAREQVMMDAMAAKLSEDNRTLNEGGTGAQAYADAVAMYLGLGVGRCSNYWSSLTPWGGNFIVQTFGRQGIPMVWDHAEGNPLSSSTGNWTGAIEWIEKVIVNALSGLKNGTAIQGDAQTQEMSCDKLVSTDPPYYDNIGYADLSDFFYVWLRRALKPLFPNLFTTVAVPKAEELVAIPYRHGSKQKAEEFFLSGMTKAMHRIAEQAHPAFPVTIYYAFKQSETETETGTASTGWETFLDAVIRAGFALTGTWPIHTERDQGLKTGVNVLASSIILVCRPRPVEAPTATRREFVNALKSELPAALNDLQKSNIAPVDLAQAAIGPGMGIYTRYLKVFDAEGKPVSVRDALALINQTLDEALAEQEGDFDSDSRWALTWFEQSGFAEGEYGVAEQLSKSKNTSVAGMVGAGILESKRGKVRLLKPNELPEDWDPTTDTRLTAWEMVHHLIRVLEAGGEGAAAELAGKLGSKAETARELCYRLYTICERKKRSAEALSYNALVQSWPEIIRLSKETPAAKKPIQTNIFDDQGE
jgi:putative DNA methylase